MLTKEDVNQTVKLFNKADAYQKERAERFGVCQKAIWQALKKLGLTYKKNSTSSESRRKRPAGISTKKTTV
ncbi:IS630 transposase-related protein [Symbiopectobacterium purcellii]|uniref:IS630 transposase-related protein n=1 Tax=Symbiopectobacterium purcellii TaxID=2871826 RepID=UPI003F85F152